MVRRAADWSAVFRKFALPPVGMPFSNLSAPGTSSLRGPHLSSGSFLLSLSLSISSLRSYDLSLCALFGFFEFFPDYLLKMSDGQLGFDAAGSPVFGSFRPTVRTLADRIPDWLNSGANLLSVLPAPSGFSFPTGNNSGEKQLHLTLDGAYARRYRRVFVYVGDIQLSVEARGAATPTHLTVVVMIPWRYGPDTKVEKEDSFIFARTNAFASKALLTFGRRTCFPFLTPMFAPNPAVIIKVGDPASGFLEPPSGDSMSSQMTDWNKTDVLT